MNPKSTSKNSFAYAAHVNYARVAQGEVIKAGLCVIGRKLTRLENPHPREPRTLLAYDTSNRTVSQDLYDLLLSIQHFIMIKTIFLIIAAFILLRLVQFRVATRETNRDRVGELTASAELKLLVDAPGTSSREKIVLHFIYIQCSIRIFDRAKERRLQGAPKTDFDQHTTERVQVEPFLVCCWRGTYQGRVSVDIRFVPCCWGLCDVERTVCSCVFVAC